MPEEIGDILERAGVYCGPIEGPLTALDSGLVMECHRKEIHLRQRLLSRWDPRIFRAACSPSSDSKEDIVRAADELKHLWRQASIVPIHIYYPMLRTLYARGALKRVALLRRIIAECLDDGRRSLLKQVLQLVDFIARSRPDASVRSVAVLLAPVVFSARPAHHVYRIPLDVCEPMTRETLKHPKKSSDELVRLEYDWMVELLEFMLAHVCRIFVHE